MSDEVSFGECSSSRYCRSNDLGSNSESGQK